MYFKLKMKRLIKFWIRRA